MKLWSAPVRYRLWRPRHIALILSDVRGATRQPVHGHAEHLDAVIGWLCRAQDVRDGGSGAGGVSAGWSFEDGWLPSYPETSGYLVETLLAAAHVLGRDDLSHRAQRILDWELGLQNEDGSFPGHFGERGSRPVIFNTGQIVHGMMAGYHGLGRTDCLEAAERAGHWMTRAQDEDGCWRGPVHNNTPHTYNTRAAWALLRAGLAAGQSRFVEAARRNLRWAIGQQTDAGWFASNAFTANGTPFTHTIAYAIRGLLEAGLLLDDGEAVAAADRAAAALAARQREDGWLAGAYADGWRPRGRYCCLTGLAQTTLIWQRLRQSGVRADVEPAVQRALDYMRRAHRLRGDASPIDGGVAGSAPIWGGYSRFEYPNWAAKFFADALMTDLVDITIPSLNGRVGVAA